MKKLIKILFLILTPIYLFGHSLVLNIFDNQDDTISVEGMFTTGESAAGALVKLESLDSEEIFFQERLSDNAEMIVEIPKFPYKIILDGGPGHRAEKEGIPPKGGFIKIETKQEIKPLPKKEEKRSRSLLQISSSTAVTVSILLSFILLLATILISIKNTNKLMLELEKK